MKSSEIEFDEILSESDFEVDNIQKGYYFLNKQ